MSWALYAGLSAVFAGLTALLAKLGVQHVNSNIATFVRTCVILVFAGAIIFARGEASGLRALTSRNWTFLVLSGIATGCSWLFYFAAIQRGPISRVAPIDKLSFVIAMLLGIFVLHEKFKPTTVIGAVFILIGVLFTLK